MELNSKMFYKARFNIESLTKDPEDDLLWKLLLHLRRWICNKYWSSDPLDRSMKTWSRLKTGGKVHSRNNTVHVQTVYHKDEQGINFWGCQIFEHPDPQNGYARRDWVTEVGYRGLTEYSAELSCIITYSDAPGFIGLYEPEPGHSFPRFIANIINDSSIKSYLGCDDITNKVTELKEREWGDFWKRLKDPDRALPYILVSAFVRTDSEDQETGETCIEPKYLANAVCGNALVFTSKEMNFYQDMFFLCDTGYAGNTNYTCFDGSIRIYRPGINEKDSADGANHRFIRSSDIEMLGEDIVIDIFRRALVQNVHYNEKFFLYDDCKKLKEDYHRKRKIEQIVEEKESAIGEAEEVAFNEMSKFEAEKAKHEAEINGLYSIIESLEKKISEKESFYQSKIYAQESQIQVYRADAAKGRELSSTLKNRFELKQIPDSYESIITFFETLFADRIAFTERAKKNISECTISPETLWEVFLALSEHMQPLLLGAGVAKPYEEFYKCTGINAKRSEGMMTHKDKKLMKQYQDIYKERIIDIEPHITYPDIGQSIHFGIDTIDELIVVGHCGKHLDNYTTQKIK